MGLSQRQLQVGEQIKRVLASQLRTFDFYGIDVASLSIMEVRMSGDLKLATVYVLLPEQAAKKELLQQINAEVAPQLQRQLGRGLRLKFTPKLRFVLDETFDHAWHIDQLIEESRPSGQEADLKSDQESGHKSPLPVFDKEKA